MVGLFVVIDHDCVILIHDFLYFRYLDELKIILNSSEVQSKLMKYRTFLKELRITVGKQSPITLDDILLLHNNLDIEHRMNLHMEPWMLETLADKRLVELRQLFYEIHNYNAKLQRLQTGCRSKRFFFFSFLSNR